MGWAASRNTSRCSGRSSHGHQTPGVAKQVHALSLSPTLGSLTFLRTMSRYLARSSCWPACTRGAHWWMNGGDTTPRQKPQLVDGQAPISVASQGQWRRHM